MYFMKQKLNRQIPALHFCFQLIEVGNITHQYRNKDDWQYRKNTETFFNGNEDRGNDQQDENNDKSNQNTLRRLVTFRQYFIAQVSQAFCFLHF